MSSEDEMKKGALLASLTRKGSQIKTDRAEAILEDAQLVYRRKVEDLEIKLNQLKRGQEAQLDMSPDNSLSLVPAKNFDAQIFMQNDFQAGLNIRETEIMLEVAKKRYDYLFGGA